ncbi:TetR/AcrR family transcriptional regulator [Neorhizobium sp. P12A]|uniref:TetR/AcrR family transcriptional regulator n=1 Tax=Neorhizobium sp. P12A TaxID=2268027 RepID=UPI0011EDCD84|nr:TetR/AcrR family transcriptional regulator [Neorhizobium sp. P12A]KAA0698502.1 TetR/AcrR family transcriptional regulator [Neorhizobium sp. P12A]
MARPRQFDETQVLEAAGNIFWLKGFEATSTRDLAEGMGLTQASLYNAFGDKRGLYMKALRQYVDSRLYGRFARSTGAPTPGLAIVSYFSSIIRDSLADPDHRGCLLVNGAFEAQPDDVELQRVIAAETTEIEAFFRRHLTLAQESGEIPNSVPPEDLAKMLLAVQFGLRTLVRIRPERELLDGMIRPVMSMLTLPWPLPGPQPDG